jgi:ectoine hydroxylase-related dioxygenase (phytanoyl-CoA dioxygenase family)
MSSFPMPEIAPEQRRKYREEGYFILERVLPPDVVERCRADCADAIERIHERMDALGESTVGLCHRGKRYFINGNVDRSRFVHDLVFGPAMEAICRATIGDTAYLFYEQYVVKAAEVGMKFGWHQDSGYVAIDHRPYVTCWFALDDVSEANGTVHVLPFSRAGVRERVEHAQEAGTNDRIGYHGDDPGIPAAVPAGSVVVFSSVTFHRSGPNTTPSPRRAHIVQFSPEPIVDPANGQPVHLATPFLDNGRRVV